MTASELFDYYRTTGALTEEDCLDYISWVQDAPDATKSAMAVSGLTLSLLENNWDRRKVELLATSANSSLTTGIVTERAIIGLLLVMIQYDTEVRTDQTLIDALQESLLSNPGLAFSALCAITRTTQVKGVEEYNKSMAKELQPLLSEQPSEKLYDVFQHHQQEIERITRLHLDQNFSFFKDAYQTSFFRERAANWFIPWSDTALQNINEDDREHVQKLLKVWIMCDSDKYALGSMYSMLRSTLQERIPLDSLASNKREDVPVDGYVQQMYRFFRLSSFTQAKPFDIVVYLREKVVYRWVVVGRQAQEAISELLQGV